MIIRDQVRLLFNWGKSDEEIARILGLKSRKSVSAYRAWITMNDRKNKNPYAQIKEYASGDYIVIPISVVEERLTPDQSRELNSYLAVLIGTNQNPHTNQRTKRKQENRRLEDNLDPLPESQVRVIVLELKKSGHSNRDIYTDPRLSEIPMENIRAYIAHCHPNMSYAKRNLI